MNQPIGPLLRPWRALEFKPDISELRPGNPETTDAVYTLRPLVTLHDLVYGTKNGVTVFIRHFDVNVIAK